MDAERQKKISEKIIAISQEKVPNNPDPSRRATGKERRNKPDHIEPAYLENDQKNKFRASDKTERKEPAF